MLLVNANQGVHRDLLIDALWAGRPPRSARGLLRTYVSGVRSSLALDQPGDDDATLVSTRLGYRMDLPPHELDLFVFQNLADKAEQAIAEADFGRAAERLHGALALWRGRIVEDADLPGEVLVALAGLEERRLWAQEAWLEARLVLGHQAEIIPELSRLIAGNPLRERLVALLMRALYHTGRQADALKVYTDSRHTLIEELGVEPGPELRLLHMDILTHRMAVPGAGGAAGSAAPRPRPAPSADARPRPRHLPQPVRQLAGRHSELCALTALAEQCTKAGSTAAVICGTAGVGKTALAAYWAHQVADQFEDGQLFVNLRGFDPSAAPLSAEEVLEGFLDSLGVPAQRIPIGVDARISLYRSMLAERRVLVVLDNAHDPEQVRALLPGSAGCLALVTSRNQLSGLVAVQGAHPLTLDLLTAVEARDMLSGRLGVERVAAEPEAVREIIAWCAGLPLALAIVAARAATNPRFALSALADELRGSHRGLDALTCGDDAASDVRAVFSWSYHALPPAAARLFRLLGLHPGPAVRVPAAASIAGVDLDAARRLLTELARAHLLVEQAPGSYGMHDLLRAYAQEQTRVVNTDGERHSALRRMLDHYLHTARAAVQQLVPYSKQLALAAPQAGVTVVVPDDLDAALEVLSGDYGPLLGCVTLAVREGFDERAWQLAWTLTTFLDRQGRWHDWVATHTTALAAARRLGDREGQARMHRGLANVYARLGRFDQSQVHLGSALTLFEQLGDHAGEANLHLVLAFVCQRQALRQEALGHAQASVDLYRIAEDATGYARALNEVGWQNALLGNYPPARQHCEKALALLQDLGDQYGQAGTWDSLGYIHHHTGEHRRAVECYEQSLQLLRGIGDLTHQAEVLIRLGDTHRDVDDVDSARRAWTVALAILQEADHPDATQVNERLEQLRPARDR